MMSLRSLAFLRFVPLAVLWLGVMPILVVLPSPILAQSQSAEQTSDQTPDQNRDPDPVFVFNRICYAQVPNVDAIEDMATQMAWREISETDLKEFRPVASVKRLAGWDARIGERLFRVGISQSALPASLQEMFPDFAQGLSTSCSIVLDDQQDPEIFMPNMQVLAGKAPLSEGVEEGGLLTTTWAGGNEDFKVFLIAKAAKTGNGGLLNVTLLQK